MESSGSPRYSAAAKESKRSFDPHICGGFDLQGFVFDHFSFEKQPVHATLSERIEKVR
jgi:hypothetical protein